jgi:hypothetical protein
MPTQTSKDAYRKVSALQVLEVAKLMHLRTVSGLKTTDSDIAAALGISKGTAAARRNDLLKEGVYYAHDGYKWRPVLVGNTYDRSTRCTVQVWAMVIFNSALTAPQFSK